MKFIAAKDEAVRRLARCKGFLARSHGASTADMHGKRRKDKHETSQATSSKCPKRMPYKH
jgi:hypothetical protein